MSGTTSSFKVPTLIKRTKNHRELTEFTCLPLRPYLYHSCFRSTLLFATVPPLILATMLEKANELVRMPGNVVPKSGATDGSFVVAA